MVLGVPILKHFRVPGGQLPYLTVTTSPFTNFGVGAVQKLSVFLK